MEKPLPPSLLLELGNTSCGCTNHTLEFLHKSLADPPDASGIWRPHENAFVAPLVEEFTARGQKRLLSIQRGLFALVGELAAVRKAQWPIDAVALSRRISEIQHKQARDYSLEDWMVLVDWLVARYLPANTITAEADWLTVRAAIAAKLRAKMPESMPTLTMAAMLPTGYAAATAVMSFTEMEAAVLSVARARAAELIVNIGDQTRHRIKRLLIDNIGRRQTGDRSATVKALESAISDEFAILNRDWRRIAITETGNAENEGFLAALPPGSRVKRWEHYVDACNFCQGLHGREFTVVDPAQEHKDGATQVWVGKTNIGRSASPRKRVGDELVERTPAEMWWPAAGLQHPNCRGRWVLIADAGPELDERTRKFLDSLIADRMAAQGP